ncbi:ATP-binding protein [Streptomyces sp. T-3]|nr:ATP-binding protein [Streptomyces sp. T-3]
MSPLELHGDPVLLRHLLGNLVRDAIRYNEPDGHVDVTISGRTRTVTNTGRPLADGQLARLFEPFQRLGQERTATDGHGLGLSIVRSIAAAHGATVTAEPGTPGGLAVLVDFGPG